MKLTKSKLKQIIKEEMNKIKEINLGFKRQAGEIEPRLQSTSRTSGHHQKHGMPPSSDLSQGETENNIRFYYSGEWHNITPEEEGEVFEEWDPASERIDDAVSRVILNHRGIEVEDVER
jgi:hypothetical protein